MRQVDTGAVTQSKMQSDETLGWTSSTVPSEADTQDLLLAREAASRLGISTGATQDVVVRTYAANGGYREIGVVSELVTLAVAASTDSTANLLPANSIIDAVTSIVVTDIPTAATFTIGDATTAARFDSVAAVVAGTASVGLVVRNPADTNAAGPVQAAAAKVRITPNAQPATATGQIRISVHYSKFVAPTS